jgi:hypothetical protein
MKIISSLLFASLFAGVSFGASLSASVTKIGGESGSACSDTGTSGTSTASCKAVFTNAKGAAIGSAYEYATGKYNWFGAVTLTNTASSVSTRAKAVATFSSEFSSLGSGHSVLVTYDVTGGATGDAQPVAVYANDGFGTYSLVGTLNGGDDNVTVTYSGHPIDIQLVAELNLTTQADNAGIFHIDLEAQ